MPVSTNITKFREKLGLSMTKLAEKAGISQSMLSRYESGKHDPGLDHLRKLAKALETTTDALMEEETEYAPLSPFAPKRLKQAMKAANITAAELARICQIDESNITRYLNGTRKPKKNVLALMASALKVSVGQLLDDEDADKESEPPNTPGSRIRALRNERGLSIAELSRQSGVGASIISRYESDECEIGRERLGKLAKALRSTEKYILGRDEIASLPADATPRQRLDYFLAAARMTGKDLAQLVGVDPTTINKFRRGEKQSLSSDIMMGICDVLGITPYDLLGRKQPERRATLQQSLPLGNPPPRSLASQEQGEMPAPPDPDVVRRLAALQGYVETQRPLSQVVNSQEWMTRELLDELKRMRSSSGETEAHLASIASAVTTLANQLSVVASVLESSIRHPEQRDMHLARLKGLGS